MSSRGVVGITDFVFEIQHGMMWKDRDGIAEVPNFFPHRVIHGWNVGWQTSIDEIKIAMQGRSLHLGSNDVTLIVGPITERTHKYPIHGLNYFAIPPNALGSRTPSMNHRATGYDTLQHMLGKSTFLFGRNSDLDGKVDVEYLNGYDIHYCPLVEASTTQHYNRQLQTWQLTDDGAGTGPRGPPPMANPSYLGDILNGKPILFPAAVKT